MAINDGYVHSSTQFSSLDVELITTINFHCSVPFSLCSTWKLAWDGLFLCGGYYTRTWKYDTLLIMLCILRAGKSVLPQYAGAWLLLTQYFVKTAKCNLMSSSERRLKSDWKEEYKLKWANKKWIFNSQILTPSQIRFFGSLLWSQNGLSQKCHFLEKYSGDGLEAASGTPYPWAVLTESPFWHLHLQQGRVFVQWERANQVLSSRAFPGPGPAWVPCTLPFKKVQLAPLSLRQLQK